MNMDQKKVEYMMALLKIYVVNYSISILFTPRILSNLHELYGLTTVKNEKVDSLLVHDIIFKGYTENPE